MIYRGFRTVTTHQRVSLRVSHGRRRHHSYRTQRRKQCCSVTALNIPQTHPHCVDDRMPTSYNSTHSGFHLQTDIPVFYRCLASCLRRSYALSGLSGAGWHKPPRVTLHTSLCFCVSSQLVASRRLPALHSHETYLFPRGPILFVQHCLEPGSRRRAGFSTIAAYGQTQHRCKGTSHDRLPRYTAISAPSFIKRTWSGIGWCTHAWRHMKWPWRYT